MESGIRLVELNSVDVDPLERLLVGHEVLAGALQRVGLEVPPHVVSAVRPQFSCLIDCLHLRVAELSPDVLEETIEQLKFELQVGVNAWVLVKQTDFIRVGLSDCTSRVVRQQTLEGPEAPVVGLFGEQVPVCESHLFRQLESFRSALHGKGLDVWARCSECRDHDA